MRKALVGALAIAAVSTLGDFIWAGLHLRHEPLYGLSHGTLLFLCIGLYLGILEDKPYTGAAAGGLIGLLAASGFYLLAPIAGYSVMFAIWAALWMALAALTRRMLRKPSPSTWTDVLARGAGAAIGSGIGFYLISGIWRPFNPQGWDYAVHYVSWTIAYLPGLLSLLGGRPSPFAPRPLPETVQPSVVSADDKPARGHGGGR